MPTAKQNLVKKAAAKKAASKATTKSKKPTAVKKSAKAPDKPKRPAHFPPETFVAKGEKIAEKWTVATVTPILNKMLDVLSLDSATQAKNIENPVRANDIKLLKEVCLCVGITGQKFTEWSEKFTYRKRRDYQSGEMIDNPTYDESISELMQQIRDICECRLQYSGMNMDIFILKNHYGFVEATKVDATTNGNDLPAGAPVFTVPIVQIITQD